MVISFKIFQGVLMKLMCCRYIIYSNFDEVHCIITSYKMQELNLIKCNEWLIYIKEYNNYTIYLVITDN